jgi:prepilin-type N-terminal cleavage/methylation domain-containing protein
MKSGFTLLELLVAMIILMVIVLASARIFDQSTVAWDSGSRKAEVNMTGRAVADFMAQEISQAVYDEDSGLDEFQVSGASAIFFTLQSSEIGANRAARRIQYSLSGNQLERQVTVSSGLAYPWADGTSDAKPMADDIQSVSFTPYPVGTILPLYVDVKVTVRRTNEGRDVNYPSSSYESRAYLVNRERYR